MESEFLERWNAKFGANPPEWVSTLTSQYSGQSALLEQDVDRELVNRQARIDKLRADLDQELFLVEWLHQQKANISASVPKPPSTSSSQHTSHVQFDTETGLCSTRLDGTSAEQPSDLKDRVEEGETVLKRFSPLALTRGNSPGSLLQSQSEESFKSTPDSSEYHTAPQSVCEDIPGIDSEDNRKEAELEEPEATENGPSGFPDSASRQRFAHRVDSSDIKLAKAVNKRLFEQGVHGSCNSLNLDSEGGTCSIDHLSPEVRKRCSSDPSSQQSKESNLLSQPPFKLASNGKKLPSPIDTSQPQQKYLEKGDNSAEESFISPSTPERPTIDTSKEVEIVLNIRKEKDNLKEGMTSEVEKRSSKEEESIELRQWANLGPGKRSSNGILDNYEGFIVSPEEERDPALLNVLASQMRSSARSTPQSSVEEAATTNGGSERRNDTPENLSPSQRSVYSTQQTLVADTSPGRGVPPALSKPERASLVFSEDECITPKGDSDHSMNLPSEEDYSRTKDRSRTLVGSTEETLSSQNVSRVERLLEEVRRTQDQEADDDDSMMTLTRKNITKFKDYDVEGESDSQEFTPLGSLDFDIQDTLSKIQNAPEMSMATLLDVGENKEMNANLPATFADPSFDDFEYSESMEIDEATISALTLSHELFGSRSNSVSSLPGLYSESTTSMSPPDMDSPLHTRQGVNLRHAGGARRRDRKRMGNAELDIIAGASDEGSDLSPSHTVSSRSMSPTSELGSLASLTISPSSPREFSGSDSSGGINDTVVSGGCLSLCVCSTCL